MPRLSFGFRDRMNPQPDIAADSAEGSLLALTALALVVGALSGLIGAVFRLALAQADAWRDALIAWAHGAVSYAAGTPGGLFAPMLALGAQFGLLFGLLCSLAFPALDIEPAAFAVVGMAGFFTGVVRAPLTGIVLVTEMTASVAALLSMLGACFAAMLVPTLLRDPPIYDSLRARTAQRTPAADARAQK